LNNIDNFEKIDDSIKILEKAVTCSDAYAGKEWHEEADSKLIDTFVSYIKLAEANAERGDKITQDLIGSLEKKNLLNDPDVYFEKCLLGKLEQITRTYIAGHSLFHPKPPGGSILCLPTTYYNLRTYKAINDYRTTNTIRGRDLTTNNYLTLSPTMDLRNACAAAAIFESGGGSDPTETLVRCGPGVWCSQHPGKPNCCQGVYIVKPQA
jgi:hypothetical protein